MNARVSIVAVLLSVAACGGSATPTSPTATASVVSPAGSWSGAFRDPISGDGTAKLTLSEDQIPNAWTGTWSATFKNGDSLSGPASARLNGPAGYGITLYVDPQPSCAGASGSAPLGFTLINVAVTSSRLTAVAGRTSCNGFSFGSVDLSKR